jgi:hypothetical protein
VAAAIVVKAAVAMEVAAMQVGRMAAERMLTDQTRIAPTPDRANPTGHPRR